MAWDSEENAALSRGYLKFAAPEVVYEILKQRSEHLISENSSLVYYSDDSIDTVLLSRSEPLINIGLARFSPKMDIVANLYNGVFEGSADDPGYQRALKLACLSNQLAAEALSLSLIDSSKWLGPAELSRLAEEGDQEEISILFMNAGAGAILKALFNRSHPFDKISDDRYCNLVYTSIKNPRLNVDTSDVHGPDLTAWDIQKGILAMLQVAPVTEVWLHTLQYLLFTLDPRRVALPTIDVTEILDRWRVLSIKEKFGDETQEQEGMSTSLSSVEEFLCLTAALYGKRYEAKKTVVLGSPDDSDVAIRCAFYGNTALTPAQMKSGFDLDGDVFVFAALVNDDLFYRKACREALENMITGNLGYRYASRCEQIQKRNKHFDVTPVSETGASLLEDVTGPTIESEYIKTVNHLTEQQNLFQRQLKSLSTVTNWGFIIVVGALLYFR